MKHQLQTGPFAAGMCLQDVQSWTACSPRDEQRILSDLLRAALSPLKTRALPTLSPFPAPRPAAAARSSPQHLSMGTASSVEDCNPHKRTSSLAMTKSKPHSHRGHTAKVTSSTPKPHLWAAAPHQKTELLCTALPLLKSLSASQPHQHLTSIFCHGHWLLCEALPPETLDAPASSLRGCYVHEPDGCPPPALSFCRTTTAGPGRHHANVHARVQHSPPLRDMGMVCSVQYCQPQKSPSSEVSGLAPCCHWKHSASRL